MVSRECFISPFPNQLDQLVNLMTLNRYGSVLGVTSVTSDYMLSSILTLNCFSFATMFPVNSYKQSSSLAMLIFIFRLGSYSKTSCRRSHRCRRLLCKWVVPMAYCTERLIDTL